jgi:uncharacterized membrane protein YphA (DoxX/SURF4 family)
MKYLAQFSRFFVGAVFAFSGFIKLQDPAGTKIKMQEYFSVFSQDWPALEGFFGWLGQYAIYVSVFMCALELILGIALLLSWRIKLTAWLLMALVVYFAFLTFYSAYYNKVTDCGCFGDFMHLEPWTSFWKDIVLMVFILIILWQQKQFKNTNTGQVVLFASIAAVLLGVYTNYMQPLFDFRAYKVGASIPAQMKPSAALQFEYTMERNGKLQTFNKYPTDTTWHYKDMKILNPEAKPKITDYNLWNNDGNYTEESFKGKKVFFVIQNVHHYSAEAVAELKTLADTLATKNLQAAVLTSATDTEYADFTKKTGLNLPTYFADDKVLKAIARVNPTLWTLKNGTVTGKWSGYALPKANEVYDALD